MGNLRGGNGFVDFDWHGLCLLDPSMTAHVSIMNNQTAESSKPASSVFVVDDDSLVAEMTGEVLELAGFVSRHFTNPNDMIDCVRYGDIPDVIVTDFHMPEMNGMELIELLQQLSPDVRTILFSGKVEERDLRAHAVKPDGFLKKPYSPERLIEMAEELVSLKKVH